jgi:hypothetical protein
MMMIELERILKMINISDRRTKKELLKIERLLIEEDNKYPNSIRIKSENGINYRIMNPENFLKDELINCIYIIYTL